MEEIRKVNLANLEEQIRLPLKPTSVEPNPWHAVLCEVD